jgi:deazaflavin-dependent oxidoreductase (nitroreductase family)
VERVGGAGDRPGIPSPATVEGGRGAFRKLAEEEVMSEQPEHQASGRRPPQMPSDMMEFNRKLISEFRASSGQLSGPMAGRSLLLLTTTGARSGEARTAVVGYGRQGHRYIVIASNNGAPAHPAWYHNLLADPRAIIEVGSEKFGARARTADPTEQDDLARTVPYLAQQQGLTSRQIPIVVLEPDGS